MTSHYRDERSNISNIAQEALHFLNGELMPTEHRPVDSERTLPFVFSDLKTEAAAIRGDLIELRRDLHRQPEIGLELPRTQAAILAAIAHLPLEVSVGTALDSVTAVLRGANPGPTVLLRADMDALPIREDTDLEYASENSNMHACGHDLHVAGLVGAARLLAARRDRIAGSVIFMFQPGEESGGGARLMIDEGVLEASGDEVVAAYAVHVMPGEAGQFSTRGATIFSGANTFHTTFYGKAGHSSQPSQAVDPVTPIAHAAIALGAFSSRRLPTFEPAVIMVTKLRGGDVTNAIPDRASLGATVRTLSASATMRLSEELPRLVSDIAETYGCRAESEFHIAYPVTNNDPTLAAKAIEVIGDLFGSERVEELVNPLMASEDFSFIARAVPSAFVLLGASPSSITEGEIEGNHSPRALFDDAVLGDQAAALAGLALAHLDPEHR